MKNNFRKVWGVGLIIVVLASLLISVLPVSAGTLSLTKETDVPSTTDNIFITANVLDMAVSANGNTIYAVTASVIYKSTNGGTTFSTVTNPSGVSTFTRIAVAPDDEKVIVVAGTTTRTTAAAWVSTNGGSTFSSLMNTAGLITDGTTALGAMSDLDIAPLDGSTRYIALAGTNNTTGALYYFNLGSAAPSWADAAGAAFTNEQGTANYAAVKFSPNFPSDQIITAVTSNSTQGPYFNVGSFNQKTWNDNVFTGYPKLIETPASAAAIVADIALDPEYLGGDDTTRIAFVGYANVDGTDGGLFRLKDTAVKALDSGGTQIYSIDWNGTNLVAGGYDSNNVYRCEDALATSPTVSTSRANKEIGIDQAATNDSVVVRWTGTSVYGVKQGTGSAFSKSTDNGKTWNDQALMNTTAGTYMDFGVSNNGTEKYIFATDGANIQLFRKATAWQRIFMLANAQTDWIIRVSPTDANVLYLADVGGTTMFYSKDGGMAQWTQRTSRYNVGDLAVQDVDVAYISKSAGTTVSKTTNGGFTWATEKETTNAANIDTITFIAADNIIVGGAGYVAYSTDGNSSWTKISTALSTTGATQVTASSLASGGYIYAGTATAASRIERWQVGQTGTTWKNLNAPTPATQGYYGIVLYGSILYGLSSDGTDSALLRDNVPTDGTPAATQWSTVASAAEIFTNAPSALKINTGSTKIWAVNNIATDEIYSFTDTLVAGLAITLNAPADKYINPINPVSGASQDIAFTWTAPTTGSLSYNVRIYAADGTTILTTTNTSATESATPNQLVGPNQTGTQLLSYNPGTVYYWAVRVATPVLSDWSAKRSFTIQPLAAPVPGILSPVNGATITNVNPSFSWSPISGATSYRFQLGLAPDFAVPLVNVTVAAAGVRPTVKLDTDMTYFWRVRAEAPVAGDYSATGNFMVTAPVETAPPVVITSVPPPVITIPPAPAPTTITIPPAPPAPVIAPGYIWAIIIIGAVLVIAVIVLIVRTRRTV